MPRIAKSPGMTNIIKQSSKMYFTGLIIALGTFLIIGLFHPIVIKTEYYTGTRYWWVFLVTGIGCIIGSLLIPHFILSAMVGVTGASLLWSIGELFAQKKRVEKGWFPMNPKRQHEYPVQRRSKVDSQDSANPS